MIELFFKGCQQPILQGLLNHLWGSEEEATPDLSDTVLLLPTRNVGRRVREALALKALSRNRAILSPKVLTPGSLFSALGARESAPSSSDLALVAAEAIRRVSPDVVLQGFGRIPEGGLEERLSLARFFLETRGELCEGLLNFEKTAKRDEVQDRDRWRALARVESEYRRILQKLGKEDPDDLAERIVDSPDDFFAGRRMVIAGTPDFSERVAVFLRRLAGNHPVEILIAADSTTETGFDDVGRPLADWFLSSPIEIPDSALHVCRDVQEANRSIAERLGRYPDSQSACICGVGTPAAGASLAFELNTRELSAHDPGGRPFSSTAAGRFFRHLAGVCFGEEISDWMAWVRDPYVARWMHASGAEENREDWIREADHWMERVLPNSISDFLAVALENKTRSRIFARTRALRRDAEDAGNLFTLLEHSDLRPLLAALESQEGVSDFALTLSRIRETAEHLADSQDWSTLGRWAVGEAARFSVYEERPETAIEVLGWLELLWEEKPWLQIPDFYDGAIPSVVGSHPLLTESLRQSLQIPCRRKRDARDAYILQTLFALRKEDGRIDISVPGRDLDGGAVSPSRLLYFTPEEELPARVQRLSMEPPARAPGESVDPIRINPFPFHSGAAWLEKQSRISVTNFSSWIRCPFTFFLERVAGQKTVDTESLEMNPGLFGTGVHEVMRRLDEAPTESLNWNDEDAVVAEADRLLDQWFYRQFGRRPGLLLELQREGLRRRIAAAVAIRRNARMEGWKPLHIEWNFHDEGLLEVSGTPISGQIDLVEERDGELRIIDYKTSDKAESPQDAHLVSLKTKRTFSVSSLLTVESRPDYGWKNLQLPLYAAAIKSKYPDAGIRVAYIQLPRAVTESHLAEWKDFDDSLSDDSLVAAEAVIDLWRQNGFWPPAKTFDKSDPFVWAGPDGEATWVKGELLDLSELESEGGTS